MKVPLPWERLLWKGRALWPPSEVYVLTDFRVVCTNDRHPSEIALQDISEVSRVERAWERVLGVSSIVLYDRNGRASVKLRQIRHGAQLAALLELLAEDSEASLDADAVQAALSWSPGRRRIHRALTAGAAVLMAMYGVAIGLHGETSVVTYPEQDAIYPGGEKRDRETIVRFMEDEVMPWARATLGPIKGGEDTITCQTCHGQDAEAVSWQMPAVAALPEPHVKTRGWEQYSAGMDAQMRNAIYGYVADSERQVRAGYMREVVMPGMARLLRRPAYDFARTYEYNRRRFAFGCYHCHKVR